MDNITINKLIEDISQWFDSEKNRKVRCRICRKNKLIGEVGQVDYSNPKSIDNADLVKLINEADAASKLSFILGAKTFKYEFASQSQYYKEVFFFCMQGVSKSKYPNYVPYSQDSVSKLRLNLLEDILIGNKPKPNDGGHVSVIFSGWDNIIDKVISSIKENFSYDKLNDCVVELSKYLVENDNYKDLFGLFDFDFDRFNEDIAYKIIAVLALYALACIKGLDVEIDNSNKTYKDFLIQYIIENIPIKSINLNPLTNIKSLDELINAENDVLKFLVDSFLQGMDANAYFKKMTGDWQSVYKELQKNKDYQELVARIYNSDPKFFLLNTKLKVLLERDKSIAATKNKMSYICLEDCYVQYGLISQITEAGRISFGPYYNFFYGLKSVYGELIKKLRGELRDSAAGNSSLSFKDWLEKFEDYETFQGIDEFNQFMAAGEIALGTDEDLRTDINDRINRLNAELGFTCKIVTLLLLRRIALIDRLSANENYDIDFYQFLSAMKGIYLSQIRQEVIENPIDGMNYDEQFDDIISKNSKHVIQ